MKKYLFLLAALALTVSGFAQALAPAFPGAEGHGRYVTGGRGGEIRHVTNLNNSGTGSFRSAVSGDAKKIVVFDVAGVIPLGSNVTIGSNTTILGQTAPAPGITLRYYTVSTENKSNIIVRFIRFRRGQEKDLNDGADAATGRHSTGIIFDHCSFSWSIDEVASFYDNNNFTMQWCTLGESLVNAGHGKGAHGYGGIWGGKLASFHHNLICHVANRSPRFNGARYDWTGFTNNQNYDEYQWENAVQAENVDFRNCVIYNCGNGCYGGPGGGQVNIVNNYYKSGPAGTSDVVTKISIGSNGNSENYPKYWGMSSRYYIDGNRMEYTKSKQLHSIDDYDWTKVEGYIDDGYINDNGNFYTPDPNHYNGSNVEYKTFDSKDYVKINLDEPLCPVGEITTHTAATAYDKVLTYAGSSLTQDDVDARYFKEAREGTATYSGSTTKRAGRIDLVSDVKGYTEADFGTGEHPEGFDTDNDGIPDDWETANGLDPNDAADAKAYTIDPMYIYTNLEVYANSLVQDIMLGGNDQATSQAAEYYPAYKKADGTAVDAVNTLELKPETGGPGSVYTVSFNGTDKESIPNFFSYGTGKHSFNSKFKGTYNGSTFTSGLKMEGTTLVQFTTTYASTVTIVQSTWSGGDSQPTIKFDGNELDPATGTTPEGSSDVIVYTLEGVGPGEHSIGRGNAESGLFHVSVAYPAAGDSDELTAKIISIVNFIAGVPDSITLEAADINGDGLVNIADIIALCNQAD